MLLFLAIGAGRVMRQLLAESLVLAVLGGAFGLLLGAWGVKALIGSFPSRIPVPRLAQASLARSF